jgi:hypothetical protein
MSGNNRGQMLKQGLEDVRQHFIGAVADEDLRRGHAVVVGNSLFQALGVRVRVQAQASDNSARIASSTRGEGP